MWKTFVMSPAGGALAALLGWLGALLFKSTMSEAEFADLGFGWPGAMIGAVALATLVILKLVDDIVEPVVMTAAAAVGAALLWDYRDPPFDGGGFRDGTSASYWFTVTMMVAVFVLLLLGLRAARETLRR